MNTHEERMQRVLVVDGDPDARQVLSHVLLKAGYVVRSVAQLDDALELLSAEEFGLVLSDMPAPGEKGLELLHQLKAMAADAYLILMAGMAAHDLAVSALNHGVYDYLSKPFNPDEILLLLKKVEERDRLYHENLRLKEEVDRTLGFEAIVAHSPSMKSLLSIVRKFAPYKTSVLITGESGTGKELLARALHHASDRREHPLIAVNCAAIPEQLLESELFGHVKGAFTGAVRTRKGLVEEAHQGTLFLDEIGELPVSLQAKLLRVLETEEVRPVGDTRTVFVDVRVVCATSRELTRAVADGQFREDLLYRINVLTLHVPPLRERREDIPPLIDHFLSECRDKLKQNIRGVTPRALKVLYEYAWPGNVRELEHVIERGAILATRDWIDVDALPPELKRPGREPASSEEDLSIKRGVRSLERKLISQALRKTRGNRTHAATLLEISHRALLYKIKEYGLHDADEG